MQTERKAFEKALTKFRERGSFSRAAGGMDIAGERGQNRLTAPYRIRQKNRNSKKNTANTRKVTKEAKAAIIVSFAEQGIRKMRRRLM